MQSKPGRFLSAKQTTLMSTLTRELRNSLETAVKQARRIAETGARNALEQLAVHDYEPWTSDPYTRRLRNRLRAHGRQLGDKRNERGTQEIKRLIQECAYEHWHRMLFARFLSENDLLIEPNANVAITLDECQELARSQSKDWLTLASTFAVRMLPQIFRQDDPVLDVTLPPETRSDLEELLKRLPRDAFLADDSLGWVYQFWQAEEKKRINESETKIGADELPAVTQLFTEDYMVLFLLHNTLGAWWAGKILGRNPDLALAAKSEEELRAACSVGGVEWTYLRFVRDTTEEGTAAPWRPAAGTFGGWPESAKEITMLDPCMGSGHFLVFALLILVAFRMTEEGLSHESAIDAVLRDNLFGLEIDQRCTQIAAFNLALTAWRSADYHQLPMLNLACSGLGPGVSKAEWMKLAERAAALAPVPPERDLFGSTDNLFSRRIKDGIARLYDLFARAPWLGSLIDPHAGEAPLTEATFEELEPLLSAMLTTQDDLLEVAVTAKGMAKAAELMARPYALVITNVPYLTRQKQSLQIREYAERYFNEAKNELATTFLARNIAFTTTDGCACAVIPQSWLSIGSYEKFRNTILARYSFSSIVNLGPAAFHDMNWWAKNTALVAIINSRPQPSTGFLSIDASMTKIIAEKIRILRESRIFVLRQVDQARNPDSRITHHSIEFESLFSKYADSQQGITTGDLRRFGRFFWEVDNYSDWKFWQGTTIKCELYGGRSMILRWRDSEGTLAEKEGATLRGSATWGRSAVLVGLMNKLPATLSSGEINDDNSARVIPRDAAMLPAIWCFCSSEVYRDQLRKVDSSVKVMPLTLLKVPFDAEHWKRVADRTYPRGLPKPHSNDPSQWLFDGAPTPSSTPLQVALIRILGYRWPRQHEISFPECPALEPEPFQQHAASDGIVCLNSLKGEKSAEERVRSLLAQSFGSDWSVGKMAALLREARWAESSLDDWLRDGFFAQHYELFRQRPFVWHVWDGRRDGFNVLISYHRLATPNGDGRRILEKLIYTYLGAWIDLQRQAQGQGVDGADARCAAAEHLKQELEKILAGEPPYDIFVRWKPLHEQPIGWEPDINDGVRINIRPFMMAKPLNAHGGNTCILRVAPNIKWDKDRGNEPHRSREDFPWFWGWDGKSQDFAGGKAFDGNRWNNLHYTNNFKQAARQHSATPTKAAT
jgi:hypothetical protein